MPKSRLICRVALSALLLVGQFTQAKPTAASAPREPTPSLDVADADFQAMQTASYFRRAASASGALALLGLRVFIGFGYVGRSLETGLRVDCKSDGSPDFFRDCSQTAVGRQREQYEGLQSIADGGLYTMLLGGMGAGLFSWAAYGQEASPALLSAERTFSGYSLLVAGGLGLVVAAELNGFAGEKKAALGDCQSQDLGCSKHQKDSVETTNRVIYLTLAASLASLGAGTYFLLSEPRAQADTVQLSVGPTRGGASLSVFGRF